MIAEEPKEIIPVEQGRAYDFRKTINDNFNILKVLKGDNPPSENTKGAIGQAYLDETNLRVYHCVKIEYETVGNEAEQILKYIWRPNSRGEVVVSEVRPSNPQTGDFWYQII